MAEALYRKYRPQIFEDVVGQEPIERTLKNAIAQDKVSHAYLLTGPRGTGKTTTARLIAKALLCEHGPTPDPDGTCEDCKMIAESVHPDVYELDAASRTGVENVREEIISRVQFAPTRGRYKVYIIDEVHMLSQAAFNALLKTLEEPPAHVVFILCTTDPQKVPETIHSRCQRFDFRRISPESMVSRLGAICVSEGVEFDGDALDLIAHRAEGGMRNALTSLEQIIAFENGKVTLEGAERILGAIDSSDMADVIRAIGKRDVAACFRWVADYTETGADLAQFARDMAEHVRNMYVMTLAGDDIELGIPETTRRELIDERQWFGEDRLARLLSVIGDLSSELKTSTNQRLSFEIALTRMVRPDSDLTLESIAERVEALESGYSAVAHVVSDAPASAAPAMSVGQVDAAPAVQPAVTAQVAPAAQPAVTAQVASAVQTAVTAQVAPAVKVTSDSASTPSRAAVPSPMPDSARGTAAGPMRESASGPARGSASGPVRGSASGPSSSPAYQAAASAKVVPPGMTVPQVAPAQAASPVAPASQVSSASQPYPAPAPVQAQTVPASSQATGVQTSSAISARLASNLGNPAALQRIWQAALSALKKQKTAYGVLFLNAKAVFDQLNGRIVIEFPRENAFAFKSVQRAEMQDAIAAALAQAAGESISYIFSLGPYVSEGVTSVAPRQAAVPASTPRSSSAPASSAQYSAPTPSRAAGSAMEAVSAAAPSWEGRTESRQGSAMAAVSAAAASGTAAPVTNRAPTPTPQVQSSVAKPSSAPAPYEASYPDDDYVPYDDDAAFGMDSYDDSGFEPASSFASPSASSSSQPSAQYSPSANSSFTQQPDSFASGSAQRQSADSSNGVDAADIEAMLNAGFGGGVVFSEINDDNM